MSEANKGRGGGRKTLEEEQAQLDSMRRGVNAYIAAQKEKGEHVCEILTRYAERTRVPTQWDGEDIEEFYL